MQHAPNVVLKRVFVWNVFINKVNKTISLNFSYHICQDTNRCKYNENPNNFTNFWGAILYLEDTMTWCVLHKSSPVFTVAMGTMITTIVMVTATIMMVAIMLNFMFRLRSSIYDNHYFKSVLRNTAAFLTQ